MSSQEQLPPELMLKRHDADLLQEAIDYDGIPEEGHLMLVKDMLPRERQLVEEAGGLLVPVIQTCATHDIDWDDYFIEEVKQDMIQIKSFVLTHPPICFFTYLFRRLNEPVRVQLWAYTPEASKA